MNKPSPVPDRMCSERGSRFFNPAVERIGIAINDVEQDGTVVEFCVSKGWARCLVFAPDGRAMPGALGIGKRTRMVAGVIRVWWLVDGRPVGVAQAVPRAAPLPVPSP